MHSEQDIGHLVLRLQSELRLRDWRIRLGFPARPKAPVTVTRLVVDAREATLEIDRAASRKDIESKLREAMVRLHTSPLEWSGERERIGQIVASAISAAFERSGPVHARMCAQSTAKLATAGKKSSMENKAWDAHRDGNEDERKEREARRDGQFMADMMAKIRDKLTLRPGNAGALAYAEMWRKKLGLPKDASLEEIASAAAERELKKERGELDGVGLSGLSTRQEELCRELGVSPERFLQTKSILARGGK